MSLLYITSDRPSVGKTMLALSLSEKLRGRGKRIGYYKPFCESPGSDNDTRFAWELMSEGAPRPSNESLPTTLAELHDAGAPDLVNQVKGSIDGMIADYDILVVEAPSLHLPQGDLTELSARMANGLSAQVIVAIGYKPDLTANEVTNLTTVFENTLLGVVVNSVTRYRRRELNQNFAEAAAKAGVNFLGALPEDRLMLSATLGQIAEHLHSEWIIGKDKANDLIEGVLVGGNIMDSGKTYFGRSEAKVVVVRGDRPDIQMAALSTSIRGLILTGGRMPLEYVHHEMEKLDVPFMVVPSDTKTTAEALSSVMELSTPYHLKKLERFEELLDTHCDLQDIVAPLG